MLALFDAWLLRLMLASLISSIGLILWLILRRTQPRLFTAKRRVPILAGLMLISILALPLPHTINVSQPAFSVIEKIRLESPLQENPLSFESLRQAQEAYLENSPAYSQTQNGDLSDEKLKAYQSNLKAHVASLSLADSIRSILASIWPYWRLFYLAAFLAALAIGLFRYDKQARKDKIKKKKARPQEDVLGDPADLQSEAMAAAGISEIETQKWRRCVSAWRDALRFYRKGTIVFSDEDPMTLKNLLKARLFHQILLPTRPVQDFDWPDFWHGRQEVKAVCALALHRSRHGEASLRLLMLIVSIVHGYQPLWHYAKNKFLFDLKLKRQQKLARRMTQKKPEQKKQRIGGWALSFAAYSLILIAVIFLLWHQPRHLLPDLDWQRWAQAENHGFELTARETLPDDENEAKVYSRHRHFRASGNSQASIYLSSQPLIVDETTTFLDEHNRILPDSERMVYLTMFDESDADVFRLDLPALIEEHIDLEVTAETVQHQDISLQDHVWLDDKQLVVLLGVHHSTETASYAHYLWLKLVPEQGQVLKVRLLPEQDDFSFFRQNLMQNGDILQLSWEDMESDTLLQHRALSLRRLDADMNEIWQHGPYPDIANYVWPAISHNVSVIAILPRSHEGFSLLAQESWYWPELVEDDSDTGDDPQYRQFQHPQTTVLYHFDAAGNLNGKTQLTDLAYTLMPLEAEMDADGKTILTGIAIHLDQMEDLPAQQDLWDSSNEPNLTSAANLRYREAYINGQVLALDSQGNILWEKTLPQHLIGYISHLQVAKKDILLRYQTQAQPMWEQQQWLVRLDKEDGSLQGLLEYQSLYGHEKPAHWNGDQLILDAQIYERMR